MGQLADASLRRLQADLRLHHPRHEWIVGRLSGPRALVQAAEDEGVDALQAGFQRAEDEQPGMAERPGLDGLAGGKRHHDVDPLRAVGFHLAIGRHHFAQHGRQRIARFGRPERRKVALLVGNHRFQSSPGAFGPFRQCEAGRQPPILRTASEQGASQRFGREPHTIGK